MSGFFNIKIGNDKPLEEEKTKDTDSLTSSSEEESFFPSLSFKERLLGFGLCCGLGYFLEFLAFGAIIGGKFQKFAILYTLGNVIAILAYKQLLLLFLSTSLLVGPRKQFKNMIDKERLVTSAMIMTLISAFVFENAFLCLIFILVQLCAYIWYTASYIPFARSCIKSCLMKISGK